MSRLRYIFEQAVKENLVGRPTDWPGVRSARVMLVGRPMEGLCDDRSAFYEARTSEEVAPILGGPTGSGRGVAPGVPWRP